MKRKFHLFNVEIKLSNNKQVKISKLSVKLKNKMSESEFDQNDQNIDDIIKKKLMIVNT